MNAIFDYARGLAAAGAEDSTPFNERLIEALGLPDAALRRAEAAAAQTGSGVGRTLVALGLIEETACARTLASLLDLPRYEEGMLPPAPVLPKRLSSPFLKQHQLIPLALTDSRILLATTDPQNDFPVKAVRLATGHAVDLVVATSAEVEAALALLYPNGEAGDDASIGEEGDLDADRLRDMSSDAPVIRWVSQLLAQAVDRRASDIHLEPLAESMRVTKAALTGKKRTSIQT